MQRLTQGVRVPVVELNVGSGVHARPDADRGADDERHGLGFGFADGLRRWSIIAALMKELVCEFVDKPEGGVGCDSSPAGARSDCCLGISRI